MSGAASDLSQRLSRHAEAVCRHYLSNGRREGRYWLVGDARNTPGRSLYVRLHASPDGRGAAGKWTDAATGEHGDLLDIIAMAQGYDRLCDTLDEARRFLSLPLPDSWDAAQHRRRNPRTPTGTPEAARRLFAASRPLPGTLAEIYLRNRGLVDLRGYESLRFHPHCFYKPSKDDPPGTSASWPAMIAAVTDEDGTLTGVHRTWIDPRTGDKADVASPRRAMGNLLGAGVRFGTAAEVMAVGEGIETVLSLRRVLPFMPMVAALSSAHLAGIRFPRSLRRLYVAYDDDPAGDAALAALTDRALDSEIEIVPLTPLLGDFNEDLRLLGLERLASNVHRQLVRSDVEQYLASAG